MRSHDLLKLRIPNAVYHLGQLMEIGAIDAFDSREDIEVLRGSTADAVIVNLAIQPVDSMEKLYMTVEIQ